MSNKKNNIIFFTIILFAALSMFTASNKVFAQDNNQRDDDVIVDSIDTKENLLDSNTVYQQDFDSLANKGEWVKINRAELIHDVSGSSDENIVEDDDPTVVKIIYVWRPRNADYEWSPYSNGRWVFTWRGWVWESDYDWGWACYNYGRWYWSDSYGWCWLPGRVWAPNWCMWRTQGSYCGWYPTCPRIHWRHHNHWVRNHTFKSKTKNWVFVDKKDFTKKIDKNVIVDKVQNTKILTNSEKIKTVNTFTTEKKQIKYNGPEVNNISKESGEKINPQKVKITKTPNSVVIKEPNSRTNTRTTRDGTTRGGTTKTTRQTKQTKGDGNYNPPSDNGGKTHTTRNHGGHNGTTKGNGPTKGNGNPTKGSGPTKSNGPSQNNGSKSNGNKKD